VSGNYLNSSDFIRDALKEKLQREESFYLSKDECGFKHHEKERYENLKWMYRKLV
jgi:Arc/MetJ-type ribon-helix-helix transcriptional regulator